MATLTLRPNAVGDRTEWTQYPASGNNYDKVDEDLPDEDSTYVYQTAGGNIVDLYNLPASGLTTETINGITVYFRAKQASGVSIIRTRIKTGGTEYGTGVEHIPTSSYADYSDAWVNNPQTSNPWTPSEIDALQIGVHHYYTTGEARVTQLWAVVDYTVVAVGKPPRSYKLLVKPRSKLRYCRGGIRL